MDIVYAILDNAALKWAVLVLIMVMPMASILTWAERRQSAMMQDRLGPNRANVGPFKAWGILHFIADAIKMIAKEDFIPGSVHRGLFALAPILALAPVLIAFAIIPFGPTVYPHALGDVLNTYALAAGPTGDAVQQAAWSAYHDDSIRAQVFQIEFGLIFYFAILTLANYGGTVAGWASYNKWALLGGLRSSSQMMSYEVAMGLSLMGMFLIWGTLEPSAMVQLQGSEPWKWGIVLWPFVPLGLIAFVLFFTASIAETKRAPFDLPEGESEIIGYFIEYSGIRWGMFFLAEFIEIVFISMVITTVFLGGYQVPFLDADGFRFLGDWITVNGQQVHIGGFYAPLDHGWVTLLQFGAFISKVALLCWFQLLLRWTLPRFRVDQLMNLGWKVLLPSSLGLIMVAALAKLISFL